MKSYIADTIRKIAAELLQDALENGCVMTTAHELRAEIAAGWNQSLDDICTPDDLKKDLQITIK